MGTVLKAEPTETLDPTHDELTSLKAALAEKEYAMQSLISNHDKLKTTLKAEIAKLDSEKRHLLSSLDEATLIEQEKEQAISACRQEVQRLRSLLAESQNKCKQTEEWARSGKEAKFREELLMQFEEERNKVEDQLKWKREQFAHLEEAYVKLQSELRELKREKEVEQLEFLGKISELQLVLDERSRLAEDLRTRLEICNQVLAREESKRKFLEAELRESQDQYNSLVTDFEQAKLAVESVTGERDEEIASLRGILADKSLQIKEIEFEKAQIDQENEELRVSLKEYREIEIGGVEKSKKFRALDKAHKGCAEKIKKREAEIENLKRDLDDKIVRLHAKEELVQNLQNELQKISVGEVEMCNLKGDEINSLQKREEDFLAEREMLLCELREKSDLVEKVKECMDREEGLMRENDRLICAVREREGVIKQLNAERTQLLEKENVRLCCEDEERKQVMKELEMCKDTVDILVKEKEMLLFEVRQRECVEQQLRECRDREEALFREKEKFICETRERQGLIEELGGDIALSREHISRLELEVCSLEEEKHKFVEIRNEMAKKLLEIKFKLDPLENKCTEVAREKRSEISGLELNLELLVEELEISISEKDKLQLELQEMATSYFLQKHEIEFREGLFCDLEMEMENLKINVRTKEDRFQALLERERMENEAKIVQFLNDMKRLRREKETLALQVHDINCGIGSLFHADGEIKDIIERILQNMRSEGEHLPEKKSKPFVPLVGMRSPLKENNF
jgi:hypothetical protein